MSRGRKQGQEKQDETAFPERNDWGKRSGTGTASVTSLLTSLARCVLQSCYPVLEGGKSSWSSGIGYLALAWPRFPLWERLGFFAESIQMRVCSWDWWTWLRTSSSSIRSCGTSLAEVVCVSKRRTGPEVGLVPRPISVTV